MKNKENGAPADLPRKTKVHFERKKKSVRLKHWKVERDGERREVSGGESGERR